MKSIYTPHRIYTYSFCSHRWKHITRRRIYRRIAIHTHTHGLLFQLSPHISIVSLLSRRKGRLNSSVGIPWEASRLRLASCKMFISSREFACSGSFCGGKISRVVERYDEWMLGIRRDAAAAAAVLLSLVLCCAKKSRGNLAGSRCCLPFLYRARESARKFLDI